MNPKPETRISLHGLNPEEALRALLAVDPDEPPSATDEETPVDTDTTGEREPGSE